MFSRSVGGIWPTGRPPEFIISIRSVSSNYASISVEGGRPKCQQYLGSWDSQLFFSFVLCTLMFIPFLLQRMPEQYIVSFFNVQLLPFTFGADYLSYNLKEYKWKSTTKSTYSRCYWIIRHLTALRLQIVLLMLKYIAL